MINGKAIYTTKGAAMEYGRVGCNFYTGCPHDCDYCYLKRGAPSKQLGGTEVKLKKCFKDKGDALEVFCKEIRKHLDEVKKTGIFFSFTTDPMIPETIDLTLSAINMCIYNDIPVKILTKDSSFIDYERFKRNYEAYSFGKYVSIGFTLTGRDDMEPNASCNAERIEAMRTLKQKGLNTFASIEPVIDWDSSERVIRESIDCCDHYKIGLRSGVKKGYYDTKETVARVTELVDFITKAGKTVYLKNSVRQYLLVANMMMYLSQPNYDALMRKTLDMDGNLIA